MKIQYEIVSSSDNPTVKLYSKLSKSKKARSENGMFVLEGIRLCMDAVRTGNTEIILTVKTALDRLSLEEEGYGGRVIIITDEIAGRLSDTRTTQGVFAICKIPEKKDIQQIITSGRRYIVLDGLQDPANIGTIIRTADAVGIDAVIICGCCDLYNPKVIRGTMGSIFRIAVTETEFSEVMECFGKKNVPTFAAVVDKNAKSLTDCDFSAGGAVIIGNEGNGLSEGDASRCNEKMTIKMHGNIESLNAAMAAGIIAWEMLR